ncbi:MAG: tRNA-uridine aminocarboxypropyltransferase [Myxococcota bacterium]
MRTPCPTCLKPPATCYCARLRPFVSEALFVILIHPKELRRKIGTGRMAHLGIAGSRLLVGADFAADRRLGALLADPTLAPAILYPARGALDLGSATPEAARAVFPPGRRPLVIVVDGTWRSVRRMRRSIPGLDALPHLRFTAPRPSGWGSVRAQPRADFWSTIEAIHYVIDRLDALEVAAAPAARAHDALLEVFTSMVRQQEDYEARGRAAAGVVRGERGTGG